MLRRATDHFGIPERDREGKETKERVISHSQNRNLQAQLARDKAKSDEQKQKEATDAMRRAHDELFAAFKKFETAAESVKMATDKAFCTQQLEKESQKNLSRYRSMEKNIAAI